MPFKIHALNHIETDCIAPPWKPEGNKLYCPASAVPLEVGSSNSAYPLANIFT